MKKLSSNLVLLVLSCVLTFLFFLPHLDSVKIPFPADALVGLYHPFRDISLEGYSPATFPTKNPLITDPVLQAYPWKFQVIENVKSGNLPLWNPYSFSGQPLLANIQSSTFQFTNLLFFIFPFNIAWAATLILPSLMATIFMFLFLRDLNLSKAASVFGAVILPFTGFFIAWLSWGSIVATVMWLPFILLAINRICKNSSPLWFLAIIFAVSQVILSGHWQAGSYVILAGAVYLIFKIKSLIKNLGLIVVALSLGIIVSAVQILPAQEMLKLSARDVDQGYYPGRQDWFIPYEHLIQLISPDFFGNPTTYNYWGIFNYGEFVSFIGIIPLVFGLHAFSKKSPNLKFFAVLAVLALIFGLENPISKIPYVLNVPFISSAQPSRIIFLLDFALVGLAAVGLDLFLKEKSKIKIVLPAFLVLLILLVLAGLAYAGTFFPEFLEIDTSKVALRNLAIPTLTVLAFLILVFLSKLNIPQSLLIALIIILTITELFRFGSKFISFSKISLIFPQTETTKFLASREKPFRILSTDRRIMHPNISSVYGIESVDGYDPLYLLSYNQLVSSWQADSPNVSPSAFNRIVTPQKYDSPIASLLNVKYVLTFDDLTSPNFSKVHQEGQTKVYENLKALPRAYFVQEVIKVDTKSDELKYLLDPNFDSASTAVSQDLAYAKQETNASATIVGYQDQQVVVETTNNRQTPLILGNVYYPGWQAYIDGQKTQVHKVNYLQQSVIVPQGNHMVEFKFQPKSFYNGIYLSALGVLATAIFTVFLWKRKFL